METSTPYFQYGQKTRQKIKDIKELNNNIPQLNLLDIYRAFHPMTTKYTFFLSEHEMFSKIHRELSHKTHLNKF